MECFIEIQEDFGRPPKDHCHWLGVYRSEVTRWERKDQAQLVGTISPRSFDVLADRVGVSGPRNRGGARTAIYADDDQIVLTATSGPMSLRVATLAYLSPTDAVELACRLISAAKDAGFEFEDQM